MLTDRPIRATLPASDLERAKTFYRETLGLTPTHDTPDGLSYGSTPENRFFLFPSQGTASGQHTQMGWQVSDIDQEVTELKAQGVVFEEYDTPHLKTVDGIATMEQAKAAWFKDSEGNVLGLIQYLDRDLAWA